MARPDRFRRAAMAIALALPLVNAAAADLPPRKPGLWELRVAEAADAKAPATLMQQCIDAASDKALRDMGQNGPQTCSKQDVRQDAGRITIESVCKVGASTATSRTLVTGDFQSGYRMESRSSYSPPMMGRAEGHTVIEAKWLGPCKPDQRPGDVLLPGGMKMNVLDGMPGAGTRRSK